MQATAPPTATARSSSAPGADAPVTEGDGGAGDELGSILVRDLRPEAHVHLGPLAVDAHLQGQGIGSLIVQEHCRRLDSAREVGYLETDKRENVGFYERSASR